MSFVSFVEVQRGDAVRKAIQDSLDMIQYKLPTDIRRIVIKPNMCYYWDYTTGNTTDPKLIAALAELIRDRIQSDVDISIVESDASAVKCKYAFKFLGYERIAKEHDLRLVNLAEDKCEKVDVDAGNQHFHFMLPQTIKEADLRINVPKIKYMDFTKITCALKNIFGCNPEPKKFMYHPMLDEAIVALNKIMKFNLCILDGLIVPGSPPRKLNLVMASNDPVAFDAAAAKIAGVNPKSVRHIMLAGKEGVGNPSFVPKGGPLGFFEERYPRRSLKEKTLRSGYRLVTKIGLLDEEML